MKPRTYIQYTGLNSRQVIEFLWENDAVYLFYNGNLFFPEGTCFTKTESGTWFVYEAEYDDVFRYTDEEFKQKQGG